MERAPAQRWSRGPFVSVQVNVDAIGNNVVGDAANEPSIAIDPTDPNRIVIGWRQFDTIASNFRQAGMAYSHDRGQTWTFPGVLDPGQFRSDPVLGADPNGDFFYLSLSDLDSMETFKSTDGGVTWSAPVPAFGGDKEWMTIDTTAGIGSGNIYANWNIQFSCCSGEFTRSTTGGISFETPLPLPPPKMKWGTMVVGPDGTLYMAGSALDTFLGHVFAKSSNAQNAAATPTIDLIKGVDLGGRTATGGINPAGLLGQVWIATDHSTGPTQGYIYIAGTVHNPADTNITNVKFIRSVDGGLTWSAPALVNGDPASGAWHWFGTLSVAPNGRIDVIWNDTRNDAGNFLSEVFYAYSLDGGQSWLGDFPVTPAFDPSLGYPQQDKIGDYYHMISDNGGANLAYAATFNGEEDVYFLRIPQDCNGNGIDDDCDVACGPAGSRCDVAGCGLSSDCNGNAIPDECEPNEDCNGNTTRDICDIGAGTSGDCNANRVPDECESPTDCNSNGTQDFCDVATGTSKDCNDNTVPDECDIAVGTSDDDNGDGVPDECQGACCVCGGCVDTTAVDCAVREGDFSGLGVTCHESVCNPPPSFANDDCQEKALLPSSTNVTVPIDNRCATNDGPGSMLCEFAPDSTLAGADLWFNYDAPCSGDMTVSLCEGTSFDTVLAVFSDDLSCQCPTDNSTLLTCGDDTCGIGGGPSEVTLPVVAGGCYTIRVAGWNGSTGLGELDISVSCDACVVASQPQLATLQTPAGTPTYTTNRFLPVKLGDPGRQQMIQVTATALPDPFGAWTGQVWWAGTPHRVCEKANQSGATSCEPVPGQPKGRLYNWYAPLVCALGSAAQMDWHGVCGGGGTCVGGLEAGSPCTGDADCHVAVNLYQEGVLPAVRNQDAVYEVRAIDANCDVNNAANFSPALVVQQKKLGNLTGLDVNQCQPAAPDDAVGLPDVNALLAKFANANCQIKKARGDLRGTAAGPVDFVVSLPDINAVLAGFSNPAALPWNPLDLGDPCQLGFQGVSGVENKQRAGLLPSP